MLTADGFTFLVEQELPKARGQKRVDYSHARCIMWSENQCLLCTLVARWPDSEAIVLINQNSEFSDVRLARYHLVDAHKIIVEIDELLPREEPGGSVLWVTFWHLGNENVNNKNALMGTSFIGGVGEST
jgi:hypothetical protein